MRPTVLLLLAVVPIAQARAQPAELYPMISQGQAVVCGASLALQGVEAELITPEVMSRARPVTRLTFSEEETSRVRGSLSGYAAMVPTFAYRGDWVAEDGASHQVICVYRRSMVGLVVAKSQDLGPAQSGK